MSALDHMHSPCYGRVFDLFLAGSAYKMRDMIKNYVTVVSCSYGIPPGASVAHALSTLGQSILDVRIHFEI